MSASDFAPLRAEPLSKTKEFATPFERLHSLAKQSEDWAHFDATDARLLAVLLREHAEMTHRLTPGTSGTLATPNLGENSSNLGLSTPPTEQDDGN